MLRSRNAILWKVRHIKRSPASSVPDKESCIHHWELAAPRRWLVHGVCRKCGAERDFPSDPFDERKGGVWNRTRLIKPGKGDKVIKQRYAAKYLKESRNCLMP